VEDGDIVSFELGDDGKARRMLCNGDSSERVR
jgi:hypothetical protein